MDLSFDFEKLLNDFYKIHNTIQKNQIHISSHDGKSYHFESGDMRTYGNLSQEDFTKINSWFIGSYTEQVYKSLDEKFDICRGRFMVMNEKNRAYSYHYDLTPRLHIPLKTNKECLFLVDDKIYRMENLGKVYFLDTTKKHTALNLSWEERIHVVFCLKNVND